MACIHRAANRFGKGDSPPQTRIDPKKLKGRPGLIIRRDKGVFSMTVRSIEELDLNQKRVLIRVDFNTPMKDGRVSDDARIRASLATLNHVMNRGAAVTLMSHLGRPKGNFAAEFSMAPVAEHLASLIHKPVRLTMLGDSPPNLGEVCLLENLRFHPGEKACDDAFAAALARFGDVFINDAFGTAHRAHASMVGVPRHVKEKGAGFLMMKEITYLRDRLGNPERPFVAILGGSKISDKLKVVKHLTGRVDQLILGGAMSYTFLKAQGVAVGRSRVEEDFLDQARDILALCESRGIKLLLPLDHVVAETFDEQADATITLNQHMDSEVMGLDIGPETIHHFTEAIAKAKTCVWNGPMGVFEWEKFSTGTISVAEALADSRGLSIVGGGDSVAAVAAAGVADRIDHISTGGGASLELLAGHVLPGIAALEEASC